MNGASSLCNSVLLHSHSLSRFQSSFSFASPSPSSYLISPCFTTSTYISIPHRFRAVVVKRNDGFRSSAVKKRRSGGSGLIEPESSLDDEEEEEDEDEDWDEFDVEAEGDEGEDEGEFLPMEKMKKWLEKKPRGFGVGKKYETSIEDKLLEEIEQSWKAQAANLNKLKNDPLKPNLKRDDNLIKGTGETQIGFRVRVTNLPKKKNVHRDLKVAFKEVSGVLNIAPAVTGNKKTKDPVCKGFALVDFKSEVDANRFVEEFSGQRLSFGKVVKQIKCQVVDFSSNQSASEEKIYSDTVFEELPFPGLEALSKSDVVVEDAFLNSGEESDASDEEVDETDVEEVEGNGTISSNIELRRDSKTELESQKQVVKREISEDEELKTPLVSFQANKSEEAVAETLLDDDDELDRSNVEEEEVDEENLEPMKSSMSTSDEQRIERIRRLELKLLGREKLVSGGGGGSDQPEAKTGVSAEAKKEKEKKKKKKKKKMLVKGQGKIEIPGSSKRLKVKEKALLTGVLVKYAAKAASTSNDE
uniref:RRM domain-containing protein n=1 Tax=Noccaea caerulescens TaxID=107243 RepID=A0A1J3E7N6_NOCCA